MNIAELSQHGLLQITGGDARSFLHAQLTNSVEGLGTNRACHAGWCSAKGRLLASLLVVPHEDGFLLQLARDLAAPVAKRLAMFILRSKVRIANLSEEWRQYGVWGADASAGLPALGASAPQELLGVATGPRWTAVRLGAERYLMFGRSTIEPTTAVEDWMLQDVHAGIPLVTQATQDLFVPQMVNFERIGAVDFQKGCYPGQEIVARAQYRGQIKRRMVRVRTPVSLRPGQDLYADDVPGQPAGTVVNVAGDEALAVLQISTVESGSAVRAEAGGSALEVLPLPYQA